MCPTGTDSAQAIKTLDDQLLGLARLIAVPRAAPHGTARLLWHRTCTHDLALEPAATGVPLFFAGDLTKRRAARGSAPGRSLMLGDEFVFVSDTHDTWSAGCPVRSSSPSAGGSGGERGA